MTSMALLIPLLVVAGLVLLVVMFVIGLYNGLQRKKLGVENSWSDIPPGGTLLLDA